MTKKKLNTWDEKQRQAMCDAIFKDHPDLKKDSLQIYYVDKLVESYLTDPDTFNKRTTEYQKVERKGKLPEPKKLPQEIVCITKGTGVDPQPAQPQIEAPNIGKLTVNDNGMIEIK